MKRSATSRKAQQVKQHVNDERSNKKWSLAETLDFLKSVQSNFDNEGDMPFYQAMKTINWNEVTN